MNIQRTPILLPVFLFILAVLAPTSPVLAQGCLEYSAYPFLIDEADTPGSALAVEKSGEFLFVADGPAGLQVFDASNPDRPTLVHTLAEAADARDLALGDTHAFVAAGNSGIRIIDISNPLAPVIVDGVSIQGFCSGVFLQGDLALVAVQDIGLDIINVADPLAPYFVKRIESPGTARAVTANEFFAFLADGTSGIQIIDLLDPVASEIQGVINTPGNAINLVYRSSFLYVADGTSGLSILDRAPDYSDEAYWRFNNNGLDSSYRNYFDPDRTPLHPATLVGNASFVEFPEGLITDWGLFTAEAADGASFAPPIGRIEVGRMEFRFRVDTLLTVSPGYSDPIDIISSDSPGWNMGDFRVSLDPSDGTLVFAQEDPNAEAFRALRTGLTAWEEDVWYEVDIYWSDLGRKIMVTWADTVDVYEDISDDVVLSPCFSLGATDNFIGTRGENSFPAGLTIDHLKVVDSNPAGHLEKIIPLEGYAQDLDFRDDHAFVALEFGDLMIVDCSPGANWEIVGMVDTPERLQSLAVAPLHVYALDKDAGLQVARCGFPHAPPVEGVLDTPGSAYGVVTSGNLAYVADRDHGLQVVDLAAVSAPAILGQVATAGNAMDVVLSGNYAYVAEAVFSGSTDKSAFAQAVFPKNPFPAPGEKAGGYSGLQIIDVTDPGAPVVTGTVETPGFALAVEVSGTYAFVADFESFVVIEASFPPDPVVAASLETPGRPRDLAIQNDLAYVADLIGLQVIDISIPSTPQVIGSVATPGPAYGVDVTGTLAFVADVDNGLQVIDVSDPGQPVIIGTASVPGGAYGVKVLGNYAYVAGGYDTRFSGLHILDLTQPAQPLLIGSIDTPGSVYDIALDGIHLYVTDGGMGLQIYSPQCDSGPSPGYSADFSLTRNDREVVFTWKSEPGLDASAFRLTGAVGGHEWDIPLHAEPDGIFSASDPAAAEHAGESVVYTLYRRDSGNDWQVVATEEVQYEAPRIITRLVGVHPNPFNPQTTVSFAVGNRQRVKFRVYDLAGRLVAELADRVYEPGNHTAAWNGKNASGGDVASGVFFLRMETGEFTEVEKITLVR